MSFRRGVGRGPRLVIGDRKGGRKGSGAEDATPADPLAQRSKLVGRVDGFDLDAGLRIARGDDVAARPRRPRRVAWTDRRRSRAMTHAPVDTPAVTELERLARAQLAPCLVIEAALLAAAGWTLASGLPGLARWHGGFLPWLVGEWVTVVAVVALACRGALDVARVLARRSDDDASLVSTIGASVGLRRRVGWFAGHLAALAVCLPAAFVVTAWSTGRLRSLHELTLTLRVNAPAFAFALAFAALGVVLVVGSMRVGRAVAQVTRS